MEIWTWTCLAYIKKRSVSMFLYIFFYAVYPTSVHLYFLFSNHNTHSKNTQAKQNQNKTHSKKTQLITHIRCVRSNYKFMSLLYCLQLDYLLSLICSAKFDENNKLNVDKNRSLKLLENFLSVRVFSLLQKFSLKKHVFFSIFLVFSNTISIRITQAHRPKDLSIKWMRC